MYWGIRTVGSHTILLKYPVTLVTTRASVSADPMLALWITFIWITWKKYMLDYKILLWTTYTYAIYAKQIQPGVDMTRPNLTWYCIRPCSDWGRIQIGVRLYERHPIASPNRLQRKPLVSVPGMRHGTCVTHVPRCMLGSLTRGGGENVPGIPCACATRNFTYLVRGPWCVIF